MIDSRHRKTHDRPYQCGLCPRKYALKTDLERHGAQHEQSSARFNCPLPNCAHGGSVRKDNLLKHMIKKHLDIDGEDQLVRKKELLQLYKKATENEKVLTAQRARKLALLEAVTSGDESIVRHALNSWADTHNCYTPEATVLSELLLRAATDGKTNIVSWLIAKGALVDVRDRDDRTPLRLAAEAGHEATVKHLVERGAQVDSKDRYLERTSLSWAAVNGNLSLVSLLIERGAQVDFKDGFGKTPLLLAAKAGHGTVVKYLLEKGAQVDSRDRYHGRTSLSWAAVNGNLSLVSLLIEKGAQVDFKANWGETPLFSAAQRGYTSVVQHLLEAGADIKTKNGCGEDLLEVSKSKRMRLLLREYAARMGHLFESEILAQL